jgi:hypothetical protein
MSGFWIMIGLVLLGYQIEYGLRAIAHNMARAIREAKHGNG